MQKWRDKFGAERAASLEPPHDPIDLQSGNTVPTHHDDNDDGGDTTTTDTSRYIPPFIACGDLSAWDSDATYQLDEPDPGPNPTPRNGSGAAGGKRHTLDPVQNPTAPPYKTALEMRRLMAGELKGRERAGRGGGGGGGDKGDRR